jgi:hypothetical protein
MDHSYQVKDRISNNQQGISNIQGEQPRAISLKLVLLEGLSAEGGLCSVATVFQGLVQSFTVGYWEFK